MSAADWNSVIDHFFEALGSFVILLAILAYFFGAFDRD